MWDERALTTPIFSLSQHNVSKGKPQLTTPVFVRDNSLLCTGVGNPALTLYNTALGTVEKSIFLGFTPSAFRLDDCELVAAVGTNSLYFIQDVAL